MPLYEIFVINKAVDKVGWVGALKLILFMDNSEFTCKFNEKSRTIAACKRRSNQKY